MYSCINTCTVQRFFFMSVNFCEKAEMAFRNDSNIGGDSGTCTQVQPGTSGRCNMCFDVCMVRSILHERTRNSLS